MSPSIVLWLLAIEGKDVFSHMSCKVGAQSNIAPNRSVREKKEERLNSLFTGYTRLNVNVSSYQLGPSFWDLQRLTLSVSHSKTRRYPVKKGLETVYSLQWFTFILLRTSHCGYWVARSRINV
jgi:hypothetical protein